MGISPSLEQKLFSLPAELKEYSRTSKLAQQKESLSKDDILNSALHKEAGCDWGQPDFQDGLQAQIQSFNEEAEASPFCLSNFRLRCIQSLKTRLRMVGCLKKHPEILQEPVTRPIFVTGMLRTGTTFLHRLLAMDPNNRPLLNWEQSMPLPPPDPETYQTDKRIAIAGNARQRLLKLAPPLAAMHSSDPLAAEECNGLFDPEFASLPPAIFYHMPSYFKWLMARDMTTSYRFYKTLLQMLNWKFPERRWTLKAPVHLFFLDALLEVFPDAIILWNHRDPLQALGSASSLCFIYRELCTGEGKPHQVGAETQQRMALAVERAMKVREESPSHFFDVGYQKLIKDPISMVESIYAHFNLPVSDAFRSRMQAWIVENRQHKHGVHKYSLEQYGLDRGSIEKQFSAYSNAYKNFLQP